MSALIHSFSPESSKVSRISSKSASLYERLISCATPVSNRSTVPWMSLVTTNPSLASEYTRAVARTVPTARVSTAMSPTDPATSLQWCRRRTGIR
ncbi:MAG TPA: hypothetical protein VGE61_01060 [Glycomyces sp.]